MMIKHTWHGQNFWLHPNRLMYWEEEQTLIGADFHLGKTGHFRKAGIAMPQQVFKEDLHRLFTTIQYFQPKKILVVGDLFHSSINQEFEWFLKWRNDLTNIDFLLVKGNHDFLAAHWYHQNGIQVQPNFESHQLFFTHEPMATTPPLLAAISGHLHPGIGISGGGRQRLRLPCFYFNPLQCVLPAFSLFTGLHILIPTKADNLFAVLPANATTGQQGCILKIET